MPHMKGRMLKKLNRPATAGGVESAIRECGYIPFEEGDIEGLKLMTVFKARERHTARRKKADGLYLRVQSFTSPEGAEDHDFLVINAERRVKPRGEDKKKFAPLYYKIFYKKIN